MTDASSIQAIGNKREEKMPAYSLKNIGYGFTAVLGCETIMTGKGACPHFVLTPFTRRGWGV
jgi:hypothetical protein